MPTHLQVETSRLDDAAVIVARGELDLASSDLLESALGAVTEDAGVGHVIVDLRELQFVDSVGLSVLIRADQRVRESGRRFGLTRGSSQVQRLLDLTGLASRVAIADTPEQLIAAG